MNLPARRGARFRLSGWAVLLGCWLCAATWTPTATRAMAGDAILEIPIPEPVEKGLEKVGVQLESKSGWPDKQTLWIVGSILVAGVAIAYAVKRGKS